ncbi:hypothetical protein J4457_03195 [Candidatus Woesearchaeota archaeon]|nr:hypothetical protein [Candidatus Woesearchaeota archaeon]
MAFMDKLMFWKKRDEFGDLGKEFGAPELGLEGGFGKEGFGGEELPGFGEPSPSPSQPQAFGAMPPARVPMRAMEQVGQPMQAFPEQPSISKDIEIISVKLDSIRNTLEILNQRIARLEKIAEGETEQRRWV